MLCVISQSLFEEGLSGGSISAGADERLTTAWLNTFPPRPSCPRITQFAQSLLPARSLACCREMSAQRETTLLRWPPALGREEPGWGIQGATLPCGYGGNEQRKKGGRGGQLTKSVWLCPGKNNREGPSEGPQLSHPHHITHAFQSTERCAVHFVYKERFNSPGKT